ncbi:MAG: VWA domain-containing protein [Aeropyrum sp.]|nr:VWA domain-containing protein [Aeropyrum sp.]MCE4616481.1 VWA domain-containing protein [Aeropyrum sp.]
MQRHYDVSEIRSALPRIAESLRSAGYSVGISDVVELARIVEAYADLSSRSCLSEEEVEFLAGSIIKNSKAVELLMSELRKATGSDKMRERVERIEREISLSLEKLRVRPGGRISKKKASRGGGEAIAAYMKLRNVGAIRGKPGRERVLDSQGLRSLAYRLARDGFDSLEEAYRSKRAKPDSDRRLMEAESGLVPKLAEMDEKSLIELGWASIKKGNSYVLKEVGKELSRRALSGSLTRAEEAYPILKRAGILNREVLARMVAQDPSLASRPEVDVDVVARAAGMVSLERAGEIVSKKIKTASRDEAEVLLRKISPEALWAVKSHRLGGEEGLLFSAAVKAAASLRSALRYSENGGEGWREMGEGLAVEAFSMASSLPPDASLGGLSRATVFSMAETAISILSLNSRPLNDPEKVVETVRRLDLPVSIRVLRSLYGKTFDEGEREVLVRSMERILYKFSSRIGLRLLPKTLRSELRSHRVDVRSSIYKSIRTGSPTLVYRSKLKAAKINLALDVSSSMLEYSSWAIAVASLFLSNIVRLTLFSHKTHVLDGPLSRREVARTLLSAEFRGFTDVSRAIEETAFPGARRLVVVSDLQQTVDSTPLPAVVRSLSRRGYRIAFIAPPSARLEDVESVREAGASVIIAWTPRQAALGILRHLLRR